MTSIQRCECGTCKRKDPGNRGYIWQCTNGGKWRRLHAIK
jgi:hypothetical protein